MYFPSDVSNYMVRVPRNTNIINSNSPAYIISTSRDCHYTSHVTETTITVTTKGFRGWSDTSSHDNCFFRRSPELSLIRHDLSNKFGVTKTQILHQKYTIN